MDCSAVSASYDEGTSCAVDAATFPVPEYSLLTMSYHVEVRSSQKKGKGLFAAEDFKAGDIFFEEIPLVGWPVDSSHAPVRELKTCEDCLRLRPYAYDGLSCSESGSVNPDGSPEEVEVKNGHTEAYDVPPSSCNGEHAHKMGDGLDQPGNDSAGMKGVICAEERSLPEGTEFPVGQTLPPPGEIDYSLDAEPGPIKAILPAFPQEPYICSMKCFQRAFGNDKLRKIFGSLVIPDAVIFGDDASTSSDDSGITQGVTEAAETAFTVLKEDSNTGLDSACDLSADINELPSILSDQQGDVPQVPSEDSVVGGWMLFLPKEKLEELRRMGDGPAASLSDYWDVIEDSQPTNGDEVSNSGKSPINAEALGRTISKIAATTAYLYYIMEVPINDAYSMAWAPFKRMISPEKFTIDDFDAAEMLAILSELMEEKLAKFLSEDIASHLLCIETIHGIMGKLILNAQAINIWGASWMLGTVIVMRSAGIFCLQSCMNHSCEPNASVTGMWDSGIEVSAQRDIHKGEEICVSYIRLDQSLEARRNKLLTNYLFACDCKRCLREQGGGLDAIEERSS